MNEVPMIPDWLFEERKRDHALLEDLQVAAREVRGSLWLWPRVPFTSSALHSTGTETGPSGRWKRSGALKTA